MLQKSKWNMDLLGRGGRAGKGTAGEKAINPAEQQGQPGAESEPLNACERVVTRKSNVSKKKKKSHLAKQTGSHL